jgi:hypothetical protein
MLEFYHAVSGHQHLSQRALGAEYGGHLAREDAPVALDEGDVRVHDLAVTAFPAELAHGLDYQEQSLHARMVVRKDAPAGVDGELSSR